MDLNCERFKKFQRLHSSAMSSSNLSFNSNSNSNKKNKQKQKRKNMKSSAKERESKIAKKTDCSLHKISVIHSSSKSNYRSIRVPGHRMIHVRNLWSEMCDPIVSKLQLQIRMNSRKNLIELRTTSSATIACNQNGIQSGADFVRAVVLGFEIRDAIALIRLSDIYLSSFDIRDIKFFNKKSDHWMRAVGRIAGQYGKIKFSIENSTNTRVIVHGFNVHILGSFSSIRLARSAISRLVIGSSPGNVYAKLRLVSNRLKHSF